MIGHANDVLLYRKLIARGVSDYLIAPIDARQALGALSALYSAGRCGHRLGAPSPSSAPRAASAPRPSPITWPGRSARDLRKNVCICDLDLPFGTAGLDFNQDPAQGLAEAVFAPDRLDENFIDKLHAKLCDGLSLMAAPATLERDYDLDGMAFDPAITLIRRQVPCVILDVPHVWTRWARQTLVAADDVVGRRLSRPRQSAQRQEPGRFF